MTHTYTISDDLYAVILNDGEEVGRYGAWENVKEAEAWAKGVVATYNDKTKNPDSNIFPNVPMPKEPEPTFIPNAPKEINSPNA